MKLQSAPIGRIVLQAPRTEQFLPSIVAAMRALQKREEMPLLQIPLRMRPPPAWVLGYKV